MTTTVVNGQPGSHPVVVITDKPSVGPPGPPGPPGSPGVVVQPTPPADHTLLWVDTSL